MSIKRTYETKIYCDVCGGEITGAYWRVVTGHHDWISNRDDHIVEHDVCNLECLLKEFVKYYGKSNSEDNSEYINIIHCNWSKVGGGIDND